MTPTIPEAAIRAMRDTDVEAGWPDSDVEEGQIVPAEEYISAREAEAMLHAALPHLLPGLYVARENGYLQVWQENPEQPSMPRAVYDLELRQILAALLPDRTNEEA